MEAIRHAMEQAVDPKSAKGDFQEALAERRIGGCDAGVRLDGHL
jgi:hypothetical protein